MARLRESRHTGVTISVYAALHEAWYGRPAFAVAGFERDGVRAAEAVRRQCAAGAEADRRSADLSRWQAGGVHRANRGRRGQQETGTDLDRTAGGRRAPTDHPRGGEQPAPALVSGFEEDCLRLRPRRHVANLADGCGWR